MRAARWGSLSPAMCASSRRSSSATGVAGGVEQALPVDLERGEDALDGELRPVARVLGERADHPDRFAGRGGRGRLIDVVPHDRGDDAGAVGEREPHVVRPRPRAADLALADEQYLVDGASVPEVADIADGWGGVDEFHVLEESSRHAGFLTAGLPIWTCQVRTRIRDLTVMSQQPVRVVVEKRRSGCGTWLAVMVLLGLAIEYWYVSLGIVAVVIAIALVRAARQRELARHRPGPRDPWLNEVAVALADLGLREIARNTGAELGGAPMDGDIGLQARAIPRLRQPVLGPAARPAGRARTAGQTRGAGRGRRRQDRDQDRGSDRVRRQRTRFRRRRIPPRRGRSRRRPRSPVPPPLHPALGRPHVSAVCRRRIPMCSSSSGSSANCGRPGCSRTPSSRPRRPSC